MIKNSYFYKSKKKRQKKDVRVMIAIPTVLIILIIM